MTVPLRVLGARVGPVSPGPPAACCPGRSGHEGVLFSFCLPVISHMRTHLLGRRGTRRWWGRLPAVRVDADSRPRGHEEAGVTVPRGRSQSSSRPRRPGFTARRRSPGAPRRGHHAVRARDGRVTGPDAHRMCAWLPLRGSTPGYASSIPACMSRTTVTRKHSRPARETLGPERHHVPLVGSTPAYAGDPVGSSEVERTGSTPPTRGALPAVLGPTSRPVAQALPGARQHNALAAPNTIGLEAPAPTRGRHDQRDHVPGGVGSTPAYAGTTRSAWCDTEVVGRTPRLRGDDDASSSHHPIHREAPPPTRGRLLTGLGDLEQPGSTPAYAGTTARAGRA